MIRALFTFLATFGVTLRLLGDCPPPPDKEKLPPGTGCLVGNVYSEKGKPIRARATVKTPDRVSADTNKNGYYVISGLEPRHYEVTFSAMGFHDCTATAEVVEGKATSIKRVYLLYEKTAARSGRPCVTELVTVSGGVPTATENGTIVLTSQTIDALPSTNRSVTNLSAPSAIPSEPFIAAASDRGSDFVLDGITVTDAFDGSFPEFAITGVEEISIRRNAADPSLGRYVEQSVSMLTGRGTNNLTGSIQLEGSDRWHSATNGLSSTAGQRTSHESTAFTSQVGGPLLFDHLYFFFDGAWEKEEEMLVASRSGEQRERTRSNAAVTGKLTAIYNKQTLTGSFAIRPTNVEGAITDIDHPFFADSTITGSRSQRQKSASLSFVGILSNEFFIDSQGAAENARLEVEPDPHVAGMPAEVDLTNLGRVSGGFGFAGHSHSRRRTYRLNYAWLRAHHELRGGVYHFRNELRDDRRFTGGALIRRFRDSVSTIRQTDALSSDARESSFAAFAQERWIPRPNLKFDLGLRWDRQTATENGAETLALGNQFAPRLAIQWDPDRLQDITVFASAARVYDRLPLEIVSGSLLDEREVRIGERTVTLGGRAAQPTELRGARVDEFTLRMQWMPKTVSWRIGLTGSHRDYDDLIEDFVCTVSGDYCLGNPGFGAMKQIFGSDLTSRHALDRAHRVRDSIEADVTFISRGRGQVTAIYALSHSRGNADPWMTFARYPIAYDFGADITDAAAAGAEGPLADDRRHVVRLFGTWELTSQARIGLEAHGETGFPVTRRGYSNLLAGYPFVIGKRGAAGRAGGGFDADVRFAYVQRILSVQLEYMADALNIFDAQTATEVDERWSFDERDNSATTPTNPDFGRAISRTPPRTLRLGVKVTF